MTHHCPECDRKTLPPAVYPAHYRLCPKCGANFQPQATTTKR